MDTEQRKIYTLLDLTKSLQSVIRKTYTSAYWIQGEIARLNFYPKSGHCYPDMVYKVNGKVKAEMRAIIWRDDFRRMNQYFSEVVKAELRDGMQILFKATVSFHPQHGLSLNIIDIEPTFTLGEMAREKAETVKKLKQEEVFNLNKTLKFPLLPKRLAIVSVSTSKGYHDFLNIVENNRYGFHLSYKLFSALLQGDKCAASIAGQLDIIRNHQHEFDAVAIIRGGGGDVGLNAYDDYALAKEVATFPLPVITGIGHSTNETVVEMVAHLNKITPTDVGYFFLNIFLDLWQDLQNNQARVITQTRRIITANNSRLKHIERFLSVYSAHNLQHNRARLSQLELDLVKESSRKLKEEKKRLQQFPLRIPKLSEQTIKQQRAYLKNQAEIIHLMTGMQLKRNKNRLKTVSSIIDLVDPDKVLKRGYSITSLHGKTITEVDQVKSGDLIETRLSTGSFASKVK